MSVRWFEDSLPTLVESLATEWGSSKVSSGVALRDSSGRLAFYASEPIAEPIFARLTDVLRSRLGVYARADQPLVLPEAPGAQRVLTDPSARTVDIGDVAIRYIDRRVVGADWLRAPAPVHRKPPRFVFASLKGGVGRSTGLSIVAAEQARQGRNVLVVDLDLEAPGIGSMLLNPQRRPAFGALDYLVERNLRGFEKRDLDELVGTSALTSGAGVVDVVPAVGSRSSSAPHNYLSKLSRAMIEGLVDGEQSVAEKISEMLELFEARRRYDLVLLDARAGLAELAAGPFLALGANVLLFGTAQPQTLEGLRFLFAHLASLVSSHQRSPWQTLQMVHGKAQLSATHERFKDELWELFSEYLYEEQTGLEGFNFDVDEPGAPHNPIVIPLDSAFADWNPVDAPDRLVAEYYARTFEKLLRFVDDTLANDVQ